MNYHNNNVIIPVPGIIPPPGTEIQCNTTRRTDDKRGRRVTYVK